MASNTESLAALTRTPKPIYARAVARLSRERGETTARTVTGFRFVETSSHLYIVLLAKENYVTRFEVVPTADQNGFELLEG